MLTKKERNIVNKNWKYLPWIAYSMIGMFTFFQYFAYYLFEKRLSFSFNSSETKILFASILLPFTSLTVFILIFYFFYLFRNHLLKLFIGTNIALLTFLTIVLFMANPVSAITAVCFLLLFLGILYCFRDSLKLASLTISSFLDICGSSEIGLGKMFRPLTDLLLKGGLCLFVLSFGILCILSNPHLLTSTEGPNNNEASAWLHICKKISHISVTLVSIAVVYIHQLMSSLGYLFGASLFNEWILNTINPAKAASRVAFFYSYGAACFAGVLLTLAQWIRSQADDQNVIVRIILNSIAEAIEYLTYQSLVYTAIYGESLIKSGKMSVAGFKNTGVEKYLNWHFVENILSYMAFVFSFIIFFLIIFFVALITGVEEAKAKMSDAEKVTSIFYLILLLSILLGLHVAVSVISGGCAAQIAVFVEDPAALEKKYKKLNKFKKYFAK